MPLKKVHHKVKGEITKYTCGFCRQEFDNPRDLDEHSRFEHMMGK